MPNLVGIGLSQVPTNSMLGGLAYQSPDHASIENLDLKYISQINAETADTAVDIFVYDTSRDTDGGAWRKRTQHTSWYNETLNTATRGSRREFPAVAVLVLTSTELTIYDGDDPDLPMWMVFEQGSAYSLHATITTQGLFAVNGDIVVGGSRFQYFSFLRDGTCLIDDLSSGAYAVHLTISSRNVASNPARSTYFPFYFTGPIVNYLVNDVAMTVLPNAPIDETTGLQVPTIAVATDGGISVIKDDGTVVSSAGDAAGLIEYLDNNYLIITRNNNTGYFAVHNNHFTSGVWNANANAYYSATIPVFNQSGYINGIASSENGYFGNSIGVHIYDALSSSSTNTNGLFSNITTSYNTGWMHGDIKGAFLSDTDTTNVTGSELITNGTFDSDTSNWTANSNATISVDIQRLKFEQSNSAGPAYVNQSITTVVGKPYVLSFNFTAGTQSNVEIYIGTSANSAQIFQSVNTASSFDKTFIATSTTTYISFRHSTGTTGRYCFLDNVSVRIADPDRSVNDNGLQVFGTVTKSAVATGAELVAYSGWGDSNYLLQPYNSDMDFSGDFYVTFWAKTTDFSTNNQYIIFRSSYFSNTTPKLEVFINSSVFGMYISDGSTGSSVTAANSNWASGVWTCITMVRSGSTGIVYVNGKSVGTGSFPTGAVGSSSSGVLQIGRRTTNSGFHFRGSLSLLRMGSGLPSPEQIKKIYEDEKVLFQENAKATLYGSSDAVTALAYDEKTELLHVGTSSGRSDFNGLHRINNTTTAVTTAISAYDGSIAQQ